MAVERDDWYTVKEAARILKVHPNHIYELVGRGELEARRLGRVIRISGNALRSVDRGVGPVTQQLRRVTEVRKRANGPTKRDR